MDAQKDLLAGYFARLSRAKDEGRPVVYTFVPGNLVELMAAFDVAPVYPEVNALQSAMRQRSGGFIREAERGGHSEDVCSYVKCDLGMLALSFFSTEGSTCSSIRPRVYLSKYWVPIRMLSNASRKVALSGMAPMSSARASWRAPP